MRLVYSLCLPTLLQSLASRVLTTVLHQFGIMASIDHNSVHPLGVTQSTALEGEGTYCMACENNTCMRLCFPPSPPTLSTPLYLSLLPSSLSAIYTSFPLLSPFSPLLPSLLSPSPLPSLSLFSLLSPYILSFPSPSSLLILSLVSPCSHFSLSLLSLFSPFPLPPLSHFSPSLFFLSSPLSLPLLHSFLLISPCSIFPAYPQ